MVGSGDRVSWLAAPECFGLSRCGSGRVFGVAGSLSGSEFFGVAGCGWGLVGWKSCSGDGVNILQTEQACRSSPFRGGAGRCAFFENSIVCDELSDAIILASCVQVFGLCDDLFL